MLVKRKSIVNILMKYTVDIVIVISEISEKESCIILWIYLPTVCL